MICSEDFAVTVEVEITNFYEFDHFHLDVFSRRLSRDDKVIPLTPKVFDLLVLLVDNGGKILTKEMVMNHLWSEQFVEENNLTVTMSKLRAVLGEKRGENKYIETLPKYGYRFVAKVRKIKNTDDAELKEGNDFRSFAVLPFINESKDSNLDFLSDGIAENVINSLSQLPQIRVIPRSLVFQYKGREINLQSIGQELDVQAVLFGRILKVNNNFVISVEFVNVKDKSQIWAARYNYQSADLLILEREITKEISTSLKTRFISAGSER